MFLTQLKTLLVEAFSDVFGPTYPEPDFARLSVSMEYPMTPTAYPGLWVDFIPTTPLQPSGLNLGADLSDPDPVTGQRHAVTRWRYGGQITVTAVALTSLERDRLVDEVTKLYAYGLLTPATSLFRAKLCGNDLIAVDVQWDQISLTGKAETPGTPWNTAEVVYEQTISVDCQGNFYVDPTVVAGPALTAIKVYDYQVGQPVPVLPS